MELIKDLPSIFEEFSEQRRNSFMAAFEMKEKNVPFIGELFPLHECKCTNICYSPIHLFSKFYISTLFVGYFFFFTNKRNVFLQNTCLQINTLHQ